MKHDEKYLKLVNEAKCLIQKIEAYQSKIAKLAVAACDIRHGGKSTNLYTLRDFAKDTGLPYKTLQNWVRVYRNVILRLPKEKQSHSAKTWSKAVKTQSILKNQKKASNSRSGLKGKMNNPAFSPSNEDIEALFDNVDDPNNFSSKFLNIYASQKHLSHCLKELDPMSVTFDQWSDLKEVMESNLKLIEKQLKKMAS